MSFSLGLLEPGAWESKSINAESISFADWCPLRVITLLVLPLTVSSVLIF